MNHPPSIGALLSNSDQWQCRALLPFIFFGGQDIKDSDRNHFVWLQQGSEAVLSIAYGSAMQKLVNDSLRWESHCE
jgi:hypothetical protein